MEIKEIGRMIYTLRTSKAILQEELCRGICSAATLSRLETGERRPDILIFNAFFQRLGKSADHIKTVLTLEEFEYYVKRRNVEISILKEDFEQAEKELNMLEEELTEKGLPLQRQDIYRLHALLHIHKGSDMSEAEKYIHKALLETIPDFDILKKDSQDFVANLRFSELEIQLLLLYVYIKGHFEEDETPLLESIIYYIRLRITDEKFQNKELALALYLQSIFYRKKLLWQKCYEYCEITIATEIKNGTVSVLFQSLEMEMECFANGIIAENVELRKKQYESLKAVLEEYGEGAAIKNFAFFFENVSQEKSVIDEVIRLSRLRSEYSQEELSEGICSPETLSRIETGKRNPTVKNFYALMKKSGTEIGYYNADYVVNKFETLEKINESKRLFISKNFKEAELLIKEIEAEIDINEVVNRQMIELQYIIIDYRLGRITIKEALCKVEKLLELSLKKVDGKFKLPYQLMPVEISLFNQVAVYYRNMGKQKQAVEILMLLYEYLHQSKLEAPEYSQRYFMVIGNLSANLEEIDELEKSMELVEEALAAGVKYNTGLRMGSNMIHKGCIQERCDNEDVLKTYKRAYYLCGLFGDFKNQENVKRHAWENWQINIEDESILI